MEVQGLLQSHPENVVLLSLAASAAYALARYGEAERYLERALKLRPDSENLRENLERVRRRMRGR